LALVVSGDRPATLHVGEALVVLHIVPFASGSRGPRVDLHLLSRLMLTPVRAQLGTSWRFNVDGLVTMTDPAQGTVFSYTQFFRDGSAEFVMPVDSATRADTIYLHYVEQKVLDALVVLIPALVQAGASYPFAVIVSLTGVRNKQAYWNNFSAGAHPTPGRDVLSLDDVVVENDTGQAELDGLFRGVFDDMWQCFGRERSTSYDASGNRTPFKG
jgi:hypothetical protein